jgi:hypothetical protein
MVVESVAPIADPQIRRHLFTSTARRSDKSAHPRRVTAEEQQTDLQENHPTFYLHYQFFAALVLRMFSNSTMSWRVGWSSRHGEFGTVGGNCPTAKEQSSTLAPFP